MKHIITISVDGRGNISVDYPRNMQALDALTVLGEAAAIVYKYGKAEERSRRMRLTQLKRLDKLIAKQKDPELN
jgi:hypothetical protein